MKAPMPAPRRRYQNTPLKVSTAAIDAFFSFSLNGVRGEASVSRLTEQQDDSIVGNVIKVRGCELPEEQQPAAAGWVFKAVASSVVSFAQQDVSMFTRGLTWFSIPILESSAAITMEPKKVITTYTIVTLMPSSESNSAIIIGLRTGEEKRNAIVGPKGTPPLSKPAVMGTVE